MAEGGPQNPDLAAILATLANLPKPEGQPYQDQQAYDQSRGHQGYQLQHHHQPQPQPQPQQSHAYQQPSDPRLVGRPAPQLRQPQPKPEDRVPFPLIDPSTITAWKQGLRCVSHMAAKNPNFGPAVHKLMKDQEANVKAWEAGRKKLAEEQKVLRENERTHRAALNLPGILEGAALLRTPERDKEELEQYDAKVYRACKAMVESQSSSLKVLGVPFFGIKPHLVTGSTYDPAQVTDAQVAPAGGKITKEQLLELQKKMLNHLMELYGD